MTNKYKFHSDPGHGWLEVPIKEIKAMGIRSKISRYSYVLGENAFLEEDCDTSLFVDAKKAAGESIEFEDVNYNNQCFIRNLSSFA